MNKLSDSQIANKLYETGKIPYSYLINKSNRSYLKKEIKLYKKRQSSNKKRELAKYKKILNTTHRVSIIPPKYISWIDILKLLMPTDNAFRTIGFTVEGEDIRWYTVSNKNIDSLIEIFETGTITEEGKDELAGTVSDAQLVDALLLMTDTDKIYVGYITKQELRRRLKQGKFFKYLHTLDLNLERYQIYSKVDEANNQDMCFIHALKMSGKCDHILDQARRLIKEEMVPRKNLKQIAEKLNIKLQVSEEYNNKVYTYNSKAEIFVKINLADDHYFINDCETGITSYALEHYEELEGKKNWKQITRIQKNGSYQIRNDENISSMRLVKFLLANKDKYLKSFDEIEIKHHKVIEPALIDLDYNDLDHTQLVEFKDRKDMNLDTIDQLWFDFEATTNTAKHESYLVHSKRFQGNTQILLDCKTFEGPLCGPSCGLQLLQSIERDTIIFAHNLKYDVQFIFKYFFADNLVEKDNKIMGGKSKFYNQITKKSHTIYFRDTLMMIPERLEKFPEMFFTAEERLSIKKEVMPYEAYNSETITLDKISIKYASKFIKRKKDREQFIKNIDDWNLRVNNDMFKHMEYSKIYCCQDVYIMHKGYMKFREWMLEVTGLDIINYLTLASVSYDYLIKEGCMNDCYKLGGVARQFIQKCVVGGRTMIANNKKNKVVKRVNDFDAVSLYPSAMSRMGFLKGRPKVLKDLSYDNVKQYDGYFVEIDVTKINKHRSFPLINKVNKNGVREFDNNSLGQHYVDKVTLEDYITYHDIEFTIIRGYYFDNEKNYKIQEVITKLFNERKQKKKEGNPIQATYKMIMNSSYGKCILTYDPHELRYFNNETDAFKYVSRNYNHVNYFLKINGCDKYKVQSNKIIDDHFSLPQIGCEILSMSKRIMNEVICLAEDNNINIYYQDTDSMHIDDDSIDKLADLFLKKYNRVLIGENMGQFHSDFDFKHDKGTTPISIESIYCGKKSYIDKVEYILNNEKNIGYHVRLKGIPKKTIDSYVSKNYDGDYMQLYEDFYNDKEITFNLLADGVKFEFNKNYTVKNCTKFERKVRFWTEEQINQYKKI